MEGAAEGQSLDLDAVPVVLLLDEQLSHVLFQGKTLFQGFFPASLPPDLLDEPFSSRAISSLKTLPLGNMLKIN